jgi:exonuclease SbcC
MQKLKERLVRLKEEKGTACPLCGQFLSEDHRQQVTDEIEKDGKAAADTYRKNEEQLAQLSERLNQLNKDITRINTLESRMRVIERDLGIAENEIERSEKEIAFWMEKGEPQLAEIQKNLLEERFAQNIREQTAQIIGEMGKLGYDPQLHAVLRQKEQSGRGIEQSYQDLMIAKNRLEPLGREIATLRTRQRAIQNDMEDLAQKQQKTDQHYRELEQGLPDLHLLEQHLQELIKLENQQRAVVGGALQMLEVIERQKERKQRITQELTKFSKQQTYIQILEKTFGRDGIQAMLIEEVLPQMEMQANDTLSRLSSGSMSVRFETERDYKDKKRDDKMQVLDILINDAEGVQRTYDLFSGGEAFRINFAIRLALSKVLAQRAGARLQLLVIDEGFGSQDAEGRQKLIEAINLIRPDFKKILVITHLEELKDAFQARIEVQKTRRGSQVEVVVQ